MTRGAVSLLLLGAGLSACARETPLPFVGDCAVYPEGVYEYGQIGIGTCLAGPTDLALLDGDGVLAVANANPWKDFTGGSALFLDLTRVDETVGRNLVTDLAPAAVDLPAFSGAMALVPDRGLLAVTNRLSEDARTREGADEIWFLDVSDPRAPALADVGTDGGATVSVGYDPAGIHYEATSGLAFVVNRTSHDVSILDVGATPVDVVPPGGDGHLDGWDFDDVDASGSTAAFVTLEVPEEPGEGAHAWTLRWNVGTVRTWAPVAGGLHRVTGNGAGTWVDSAIDVELDVDDADGEVAEVLDPAFLIDEEGGVSVARLFFVDGDTIRTATASGTLEDWVFDDAVLTARADAWDAVVGGPAPAIADDVLHLFYDGGDGVTSAIGVARSVDGTTFEREDAAIVAVDGVSVADPTVLYDGQIDRWRMWFARDDGAIGQAVSDDLYAWEVLDDVFAPTAGAWAPSVARWNGEFHMLYTTVATDGTWALAEATSVDGLAWTDAGTPYALDAATAAAAEPPGLALQVTTEESFRAQDDEGEVLGVSIVPGDTVGDAEETWRLRVAVGFVAGPEDAGAESVELGSILGDVAYATVWDADGVGRIALGSRVGDDLLLDAEVVLDPAAVGADSLRAPVVAETADGFVMYFARTDGAVTSIGRATSADGLTWDADTDAILAPEADWESVAIEPGSVQVLDDGTLRLWYAGNDGDRWRVGMADSADGVAFARQAGDAYAWQFDAGTPGAWHDSGVRHPWVVRDGDVDRMWFSGFDGDAWRIGYAERTGDADFAVALDDEEAPRAVLAVGVSFGVDHVQRPVVLAADGGWEVWYTGVDADVGRIGRAVAAEPDRLHRDLRLPTLDDTWGFTSVPAEDEDAIALDVVVDGGNLSGRGCSALASDEARGFLYVGCKLSPWMYVLDVRDDSSGTFEDLNYLDVEAAIWVETSTNACSDLDSGQCSGMRALLLDETRGWLWGLSDEPEAVYGIDVAAIPDDASAELVREEVLVMLALPRSGERDEGVDTQAYVGPSQMALHPDGDHLFVTNFNDNSVSVFDLGLGAGGTLIGEARDLGENPYAIRIGADGRRAYVGFYSGEVDGGSTSSTLGVLDADPTSATFLQPLTWIVNQ